MYDLVIIGGGPGGVAAGVYAARKKIKTVLVTDTFGGQSLVSNEIGNWIGDVQISGFDLAERLEKHLKSHPDIEIDEGDLVVSVIPSGARNPDSSPAAQNSSFKVTTKNGKTFETKTILLTCGSSRRKLGVPGEKEYEGHGVVYCSTCDAPLFNGKDIVVVGGGNSALEGVADSIPYAKSITLMVRSNVLRGDPVTQDEIKANPKVKILFQSEVQEVFGDGKMVQGVRYLDKASNEIKTLPVQGVFIEIGSIPNSELMRNMVTIDAMDEIVVDHKTQKTSVQGIWAAGDVTDVLYKQNNISVGDAVKAVLNIYDYLRGVDRTAK
ncbi:FAD-dependent oxidoreductase [Patescibacteria group bacterium]|nr:FAD-dependent oxidoreductase [Patescibacteria group bacterium]